MKGINLLMGLLISFLLISCEQGLAPNELRQFVNEEQNGLIQKKTIPPLAMEVLYKPIDYVVAQENKRSKLTKKVYEDRVEELAGAQYYNLKLTIPNFKERQATDPQFLYYLSYQMKEDIQLIEGRDTLRPILYHFERSFDVAPYRTFVLAFEEQDKELVSDKIFLLDSEKLGTGRMKVRFSLNDLKNIPTIKL